MPDAIKADLKPGAKPPNPEQPKQAPPPGFEEFLFHENFDANVYPLYRRIHEGCATLGLFVEAKHCNSHHTLHGGALATIVDIGMGSSIHVGQPARIPIMTASMSIDYTGAAMMGSWVECTNRVLKRGRRLIVTDCLVQQIKAGEPPRLVARCNATYAVLEGAAKDRAPLMGAVPAAARK